MTPPAVCMHVSQNPTLRKRTCGLLGNGCGATDVLWRSTPIRTASFVGLIRRCSGNSCGEKKHARISDDELGMEWIAAHRPQAKGRIERLFETLQDRLVKEMRLAGIDSIATANHFLETHFLPQWEQRFIVAPRNPRNAHRPLDSSTRLEEILSVRVGRTVADD